LRKGKERKGKGKGKGKGKEKEKEKEKEPSQLRRLDLPSTKSKAPIRSQQIKVRQGVSYHKRKLIFQLPIRGTNDCQRKNPKFP